MRGLLASSGLTQPAIQRAPKPAAPKLSHIEVKPAGKGLQATHVYHGGPSKQFVFKKPTDLAAHIKKVQGSEWLHPNVQRSSGKIDRLLDIG